MIVIAGLGNPGGKYAGNRHNIGFMAVDAIQRRQNFSPWAKKFKAEISEGELGGEKILLIKPQTFMNLSGESVGEALRFYKLQPAQLIVLYDELDLLPGKVRVKTGGGHGGHNGIKSLDAHCGKEYRRVRLGIGHPGSKEAVNNHVLGDFGKSDRVWLEPLLEAIADHADMLVRNEESQFLNKLTLATGGKNDDEPKPAKAPSPGGGKSHIHQARNHAQPRILPTSGPMAEMLKKLLGGKGD